MEVKLSRGHVAVIDDSDAEIVAGHYWHAVTGGSTIYAVNQDGVGMHRLILKPEAAQVVDHADGDGLNNRRGNIRACTHAENMRNRKANEDCASRFKGVRRGARGKWRVTIEHDNERVELGQYESEEAAARQYDRAARLFHGAFARTNAALGLL